MIQLEIIGPKESFFTTELTKFLDGEGFGVSFLRTKSVVPDEDRAPPDLYLVDVPDDSDDSIEVCKTLLAHPRTSLIPIIALAMPTPKNAKIEAYRCGVDEVLDKPVDLILLRERIGNLLERKAKWGRVGAECPFEEFFLHLDCPALLAGKEFQIIHANNKASSLFGSDIVGRSMVDLYPAKSHPNLLEKISARDTRIPHFQADISVAGGAERRFIVSIQRVAIGEEKNAGYLQLLFNPTVCFG